MRRELDLAPVAAMTKRQRIEFLLDHWQDFHTTLHSIDHDHAGGGDSEAITGMPAMYRHPSVVELRRTITEARRVMPVATAHLVAFYEAEWRTVERSEKRRTKKGKEHIVATRKRERIVPSWVRRRKVDSTVALITAAFRGPVHIPSELLEPMTQQAA